ncbi:MAG: hypothetical protein IPK07_02440 [Deltaproteobacteria bacterium]|nr:hypothetical protein [Deltaproteobacteria bacterium]
MKVGSTTSTLRLPTRDDLLEAGRAVVRAVRSIGESPLLTVLATLILSLTLTVVGVLSAVAVLAARLAATATPPDQINVYLAKPVAGVERTRTVAAIEHVDGIEEARYIGPEDALEELAATMPEVRGWISALGENPLPAAVVATVRPGFDLSSSGDGSVVGTLMGVTGVTEVQTAGETVGHVIPVLHSIRWTASGVAVMLVTAMLFVVVATFRLTLEPRREEIEILRLHGATERWVRAPLWIEGGLLGATTGLVSAALAWGCGAKLGPVAIPALVSGRVGGLALELVPISVCVGLSILGPVLGAAGAAVATRWGLGRA